MLSFALILCILCLAEGTHLTRRAITGNLKAKRGLTPPRRNIQFSSPIRKETTVKLTEAILHAPKESEPVVGSMKYYGAVMNSQQVRTYSDFLLKVMKQTQYLIPITPIDKALQTEGLWKWSSSHGEITIARHPDESNAEYYQFAMYLNGKLVVLYEGKHVHEPLTENIMKQEEWIATFKH